LDSNTTSTANPDWGFLRPVQLYGDHKKGIDGLIPSSGSTFWRKVSDGSYRELEFVRKPNLTLITRVSAKRLCLRLAAEAKANEKQVA